MQHITGKTYHQPTRTRLSSKRGYNTELQPCKQMGLLLSQRDLSEQTKTKNNACKIKYMQVCVFHANMRQTHKVQGCQMLSKNVLA